ncbi:tetratricopeptide repeat protein [Pseudobacteriovorax antillogorgiicola]|uniref:Tetratricopeptide repeat-containing protein n=1 Tax=Pseudobacteriovorax antillogorgiicola TaxID=1513793 RepID=A0A1Y6B228_9BACT|nr:tetratricopeptide repeat protein [Pseudobacteriovorax antillogorgiicola]TCS59552.1 tetratricopeptide repeat protein [Pseudobacteriovorax antillogorgiicola]SME87740.1 Tetratricopeptide repeat-containing protein [Pseudobacteriovorax antillogorgiicola]
MFHKLCFGILTSVGLALSSCQTKSDFPPLPEDPLDLEKQESLSSDLWSPEQRRANANYYFLLAEDRLLAQDRETALKLYELAYNLDPSSYLAAKLIASKAYLKPEEAFTQIKRMVLLYPKDPEINVLLGQFQLAKGQLQSAVKQFNRVLTIDSERLDAYIGLIQAYRAMGKPEKAVIIAEEMVKADPNFADGWALLAKMYLSDKKLKKAKKAAERAYTLRSNNPEYIHLYAITLEFNGQSKRAVELYETIFQMNPNNDDLIARMVNLYKQIGSLEEALSLLEEVDRNSQKVSIPVKLQIVFLYWELKNYEKAASLLEELNRDFPDNSRISYMTALGAEKMGRPERAAELYQNIDESSQFYIHAKYREILVHRELKQFDIAIGIGKSIVSSKHERAPDFYLLIANLYGDQKKYDSAVEVLIKASQEYPERTDIWFLLGINQERQGDVDDCIETMKHLIKIDPQHAGAYNYLGYLYAERGDNLDEAEMLIKTALKIKPNDGYYLDSLGWVYYQKKQYKEALEILLEANKYAPNEGVILEHIGDVYRAMDQMDKAYSYYEKASKARMDPRDRDRILKKYEEFKGRNA